MTQPKGTRKYREYERPVAWLLGRQLMGSLKGTLLYTAFGTKIDPRDWMEARSFDHPVSPDQTEFWFDYIADSGDGMRATYSIAYLSLGDLWIDKSATAGADVHFHSSGDDKERLPRGEFLFVGGDTTYHLSDYATLANRFQRPFTWAHDDRGEYQARPARPLYAIPGNHDYYDLLDGFRRQFRRPSDPDNDKLGASAPAQLIIPGYVRKQESSYLALQLPWDWWLWGLDTELGEIDPRQQVFFRKLNNGVRPKKIIVATCAPTTVFGRYARWEDKKAAQTFFQLKLPWWFWSGNQRTEEMKGEIKESLEVELSDIEVEETLAQFEKLIEFGPKAEIPVPAGECRLDISGDVHLYARYWGPRSDEGPYRGPDGAPHHPNYASVVSGLGGAFHHPSYTSVKEIKEQVLYPTRQQSLDKVAGRILNPLYIALGGSIWLFGFAMAFMIYFGGRVLESSKSLLDPIINLIPHFPAPDPAFKILKFPPTVGTGSTIPGFSTGFQHGLGLTLLGLAGAILLTAAITDRRFFRVRRLVPLDKETPAQLKQRNKIRQFKLRAFVIVNLILIASGLDLLRRLQVTFSPLESSALILYCLLVGAAAVYFGIEYSEWLFEKAYIEYITNSDWYVVYASSIFGLLAVASGLWYFGKNNYPIGVVTDIAFIVILCGGVVGLTALAYVKGGELVRHPLSKVRLLGVGVWHALLQLTLPFIWIVFGSLSALAVAALVSVAAYLCGYLCLRDRRHKMFTVVWFAYGAAIFMIPFIDVLHFGPRLEHILEPLIRGRWLGLADAMIAGSIGAVNSCLWFGWYLAFCFLNFQGHNNEVGGAARIEDFKQFIRFRVTKDTITGYVIGVDDVSMIGQPVENAGGAENAIFKDGSYLEPKLIDVFELRVKGT
jgi:hypothetical protein